MRKTSLHDAIPYADDNQRKEIASFNVRVTRTERFPVYTENAQHGNTYGGILDDIIREMHEQDKSSTIQEVVLELGDLAAGELHLALHQGMYGVK